MMNHIVHHSGASLRYNWIVCIYMLIGQYEGKVGEKTRIAFPSKFREELGDNLILTKGLEKNLIIISEENWKTLLEGTEGKPFTDKNTREMQRFLLGNASEILLDGKGRFIIPEYLREHAALREEDEVVFAGIHRFVELWNKKYWEEQQDRLAKNIETIAEKLTKPDSE
jgi:MraZ protein